MSPTALSRGAQARIDAALVARAQAGERFFGEHAAPLARLCHQMAERFASGGRLLALGAGPAARSDARHVAVEFVHPVIVGKRALPALALAGDDFEPRLRALVRSGDIVVAFGADLDGGAAAAAIAAARAVGALTIAFAPAGAEWQLEPPGADADVRQELVETLYHVLWELVHVFFEHRGLLAGREARPVHDAGASSFLYPFLAEQERGIGDVLEDVRRSVLMKAAEIGELREQTLGENAAVLAAAAAALRASLDGGATLFALGNGGSATDAMDVVADFASSAGGRRAWPAVDLTDDPAILTAIANDIGTDAIFSRQLIAHARAGDALLVLSTSGGSGNVVAALAQARRQGLITIALVGYDGGVVAAEALADHIVVTRSQHIPRIQEAQACAYHVLRDLVELAGAGAT